MRTSELLTGVTKPPFLMCALLKRCIRDSAVLTRRIRVSYPDSLPLHCECDVAFRHEYRYCAMNIVHLITVLNLGLFSIWRNRHTNQGTPTRHTHQTHPPDTPTRHTHQTHLPDTPTRHTHQTHLPDTPTRHTYQTHPPDTPTRHTYQTHLPDTPTRHT